MQKEKTEVGVNSESVEEIYQRYIKGQYQINRRYQRKLVWGDQEKERLIDSLCKNIPIPLILLAEIENKGNEPVGKHYEIIDGLQRMNAIISFIENRYTYKGKYFNLGASGTTTGMRDGGLEQKEPMLDLETSRAILGYRLPVSTYRSAEPQTIDEVFRRINSSGKKLSMQEVRQAGALSQFSYLVQDIAAEIRGDVTPGQKVNLSEAPKISIVQQKNAGSLGIYSRDIFWVKNKILNEKEVREESRDEELIVDLLMDMLLYPNIKPARKDTRDSAYKMEKDGTASSLESKISLLGYDDVKEQFLKVYEIIRVAAEKSEKVFLDLILPNRSKNSHSAPRHYHIIFIAIYVILYADKSILYADKRRSVDYDMLIDTLGKVYDDDIVKIQQLGGAWDRKNKESALNHMKLELTHNGAFTESEDDQSKELKENYIHFESNLRKSLMENEMLELKIGFTNLSQNPKINDGIVREICCTATAMSNTPMESSGVIYVGIADTSKDANRVKSYVFDDKFNIVGTRHELEHVGFDLDKLHRWFKDKAYMLELDPSYRDELIRNFKPILYKDYLVWELKVPKVSEPVLFKNEYWHRVGSSTLKIQMKDVGAFFKRFEASQE